MSDTETKDTTPVSEEFERAFATNSSGCMRTCNCGVTHFDTYNRWDWETGELEGLLAKHDANPNQYVGHPYSISAIIINGAEVVAECQCNYAKPYENFIIAHAREIAAFLNARGDKLKTEAEKTKVNQEPET